MDTAWARLLTGNNIHIPLPVYCLDKHFVHLRRPTETKTEAVTFLRLVELELLLMIPSQRWFILSVCLNTKLAPKAFHIVCRSTKHRQWHLDMFAKFRIQKHSLNVTFSQCSASFLGRIFIDVERAAIFQTEKISSKIEKCLIYIVSCKCFKRHAELWVWHTSPWLQLVILIRPFYHWCIKMAGLLEHMTQLSQSAHICKHPSALWGNLEVVHAFTISPYLYAAVESLQVCVCVSDRKLQVKLLCFAVQTSQDRHKGMTLSDPSAI